MRCILQIAKIKKSQATMPGSSSKNFFHFRKNLFILSLSLFLVGSCNESAGIFDFSNKPQELKKLTQSELVRYGYALQVAMLQNPKNIKKLEADEIELSLSAPDLIKKEGINNIWQYRADSCVLDIYWNKKGSKNPVSYYEIRQRRSILNTAEAVEDPIEWQCIQTIIQDRRQIIRNGFNKNYADLSLNPHKS